MPGFRVSIAFLVALLMTAGGSGPASAQDGGPLDPAVAGFDEPCLSPSGILTVHGANFGPGRGLRLAAFTPGGFVTLPAQSWSDTKIVGKLPGDARFKPGRTYILGVALDGADAFLSNQVTAAVCAAATAAVPAAQDKPAGEEDDDGGVSFGIGIGLGGLFSGGGGGGGGQMGGQQVQGGRGGQGGVNRGGQGGVGGGVGFGIGIPVPLGSDDSDKPETPAGAEEPPAGGVVLAPVPPANNGNYEPGEIVALLESEDAADTFSDDAGALGYTVLRRNALDALGFVLLVLDAPAGTTVAAGTAALRAAFPGVIIDANHQYAMQQGGRYALSVLGWEQGPRDCGAGLRVGVLDTGVDTAHPALAARRIETQSFITVKAGEQAAPANHGTAVAAIIVGDPGAPDFAGVLPGAELYFGGVFKTSGLRGQVASTEAILRGLSWLAGKKVAVVNLSFAGPENAALKAVVNASLHRGLVIIAAAGNGGPTAPPAHPGAQEGVIAATAVDANLGIYAYANQGHYVTFAAPGVNLYLAVPGGGGQIESGTSFAAPYVTAAVAQAMMAGSAGEAAVQTLASGSKDLGAPGRDPTFGYGLVQLANVCAPQ